MVQDEQLFAEDPVNSGVYEAAARNRCYQQAAQHILDHDQENVKLLRSFAKSLLTFWDKLSVSTNLRNQRIIVFDGFRILVLANFKQQALETVDVGHVGFNKAYALCRERFH